MTGCQESRSLDDAIVQGQRYVDELADPQMLRRYADVVVNHAVAHGVDVLVAASAAAERIVGAALVLADGGLAGLTAACTNTSTALVVDMNLASGTAMATAARRIRALGARRVSGIVFHRLAESTPSARDCGLDTLADLSDGTPTQPASRRTA